MNVHNQWSAAPVLDWLLHTGRLLPTTEAAVEQLCVQLRSAGMPLDRLGAYMFSLHPLYAGVRYIWDASGITRDHGTYGFMASADYLDSPMHRIAQGERRIRRRLCDESCPQDFPFVAEFRDQGFTDYIICELIFSDGTRHSVSLSTRRAGGFSDHDIEQAEAMLPVFAMLMDSHTSRALSATLLTTYIGGISGERVLEGRIKRGDGDLIDAIIWFSDLRDSTPLAEKLGHAAFLELLNEYFDATAGAVMEHGGEVLRFIGDASLAVFPVGSGDHGFKQAATDALDAARHAISAVDGLNLRRHAAGDGPIMCGIGLNRGEVLYGNIGTPARLEFSVIGPAANEAARIQALCKSENQRLVVTEQIARGIEADWTALGYKSLKGVKGERCCFGLSMHPLDPA